MSSGSPSRILVVDDNRTNRLVLEKRLEAEGYLVSTAEDGKKALEMTMGGDESGEHLGDFDLILLDVMMPEIDGMEVLERIRKKATASVLPVIMITARDEAEDIVAALETGANDYVTKPVDMSILFARVKTQIGLKRANEALKEAQHSLVHAAKMESTGLLAGGVAHEVRNPLAQIKMGVESLKMKLEKAEVEGVEPVLEIIGRAVDKADTIVQGLMRFSSSQQLQREMTNIEELIRSATDILGDEMEKTSVKLELEISKGLPEIELAIEEMRKVLVNILLNAIQSMPEGGLITVRAGTRILGEKGGDEGARTFGRLRSGDEILEIEIEDNGPGIPEDKIDYIFDPFFTTKAAGSGTGMGLTLATKIVELHEGQLSVENRKDKSGVRVEIALKT